VIATLPHAAIPSRTRTVPLQSECAGERDHRSCRHRLQMLPLTFAVFRESLTRRELRQHWRDHGVPIHSTGSSTLPPPKSGRSSRRSDSQTALFSLDCLQQSAARSISRFRCRLRARKKPVSAARKATVAFPPAPQCSRRAADNFGFVFKSWFASPNFSDHQCNPGPETDCVEELGPGPKSRLRLALLLHPGDHHLDSLATMDLNTITEVCPPPRPRCTAGLASDSWLRAAPGCFPGQPQPSPEKLLIDLAALCWPAIVLNERVCASLRLARSPLWEDVGCFRGRMIAAPTDRPSAAARRPFVQDLDPTRSATICRPLPPDR